MTDDFFINRHKKLTQNIRYSKKKNKKINFDDLATYLLVLRFDVHLVSSTINHEFDRMLPENRRIVEKCNHSPSIQSVFKHRQALFDWMENKR